MDHSSSKSNGYYGADTGTTSPPGTDDFEDFMWMANEEEAEKEMLRQIQDEHIAEQLYFETMEEAALRTEPHPCRQPPHHQQPWSRAGGPPPPRVAPAGHVQPWSTAAPPAGAAPPAASAPPPAAADALAAHLHSMTVADKPKVALNPLAAEFVPGGQKHQPSLQPPSG